MPGSHQTTGCDQAGYPQGAELRHRSVITPTANAPREKLKQYRRRPGLRQQPGGRHVGSQEQTWTVHRTAASSWGKEAIAKSTQGQA